MNNPLISDQVYHVYNHATSDDNFFRCNENYRYFLEKYQQHILPIADTFAYCLLPNHFHFMIRIKNENQLSESLKLSESSKTSKLLSKRFANLFSAYTQAYNKIYDRRGTLFRERFHRKPVDSDAYYTQLIGYIHNNPIHHGFVEKLEDWTWSSYHAFTSNKTTKLQKLEVLDWFGGEKQFHEFHNEYKNNVISDLQGFENLVKMN